MIEDIQKSLSQDFRNLSRLLNLQAPRRQLDQLIQLLRHGSVSELTEVSKAFSKSLASDPTGGEELDTPCGRVWLGADADKIRTFRQAFGFFSRLHANVTEQQKQDQLREAADRLGSDTSCDLTVHELALIRDFIHRVLGPAPALTDLRFRHGPGAVATRERGFEKLYFKETYQSIDTLLGADSEILFRLPNQPPRILVRGTPTTRVIAVPKDAQKIRIISCEPLSMQFLQQGIMHHMYQRFAKVFGGKLFPLTDQMLPRHYARLGSLPSSRNQRAQPCTIDMSNASDLVKCWHVRELFPSDWADLLLSVRSEYAHFESLDLTVELKTFAPMGAATCYPVESLVFAGIAYAAGTLEHIRSDRWRLYTCNGDDLVVPAYSYYRTIDMLERAAFQVNVSKCCGPTVRFREACGGDFYDGYDVTYVRPRLLPKFGTRSANVPTVQLARELYTRGFRTTAQLLANTVTTPVAIGDGPAYACRDLHWPRPGRVRWNADLQRLEQAALVSVPKRSMPLGLLDGWEPLFNWFTSGWDDTTHFSNRMSTRLAYLPCGLYEMSSGATAPWLEGIVIETIEDPATIAEV